MRVHSPALFAVVVLLFLGCSSTNEQSSEPTLIAVSNFLHPPFSSRDESGCAVGEEVELISAAAARLGRRVVWEERPFGELLSCVSRGEADIAASTIGITAERRRLVAFSEPYFETTIVALVRPGADEPRVLADLANQSVATERGTTTVAAVALKIPKAVRVLDRGDQSWAQMLSSEEVDAVVLDHSHAETFMRQAGTRFHVIDEPIRREPFGFAVHPEAEELLAALNAVIAERQSD